MRTLLFLALASTGGAALIPGELGVSYTNGSGGIESMRVVQRRVPDYMMYPMNAPYTLDTILVREQFGWETQHVQKSQTSLGEITVVLTNYPGPMMNSWAFRAPQKLEIKRLEESNEVAVGLSAQPQRPAPLGALPSPGPPSLPKQLRGTPPPTEPPQ